MSFDFSPASFMGSTQEGILASPSSRDGVGYHDGLLSSFVDALNDENVYDDEMEDDATPPNDEPRRATEVIPMRETSKTRHIPKSPSLVLEAPNLQDDFYLNLLSWSCLDVLAVGLGNSIFLWRGAACDTGHLGNFTDNMDVTCVSFSLAGNHLAVGLKSGIVEVWDVVAQRRIRCMRGHDLRVGAIDWGIGKRGNSSILTTGSRDKTILNRDIRSPEESFQRLERHKQEVCGVCWSVQEDGWLASGGNDNKVFIWTVGYDRPVVKLQDHNAAVKALAWSPHRSEVLATGGGTNDRCIRFWDVTTNTMLDKIDTESQVCNISWSKTTNELVSTHGYTLHQLLVWNYPSMEKVATLTGHTARVLYMASSPNNDVVATGAGDETIRLWKVFPPPQKEFDSMPTKAMRTIR